MQAVEKPKTSNEKKGRALQPKEIEALLAKAEDETTRLIIMTAVLTGIRRGELFGPAESPPPDSRPGLHNRTNSLARKICR